MHIDSQVLQTVRALKLVLVALTATLMLAGSADAAGRALQVPGATGPFDVGTRSIALTDSSRREPGDTKHARSLVIQLWYPAASGGQAGGIHDAGSREIRRKERGHGRRSWKE